MSWPLCDIFASIQGEGSHTGRPMLFLRAWGCPLACSWCDEPKHRDTAHKRQYALEEILAEMQRIGPAIPNALLTGGEPLALPGVERLILGLKQAGYWVGMETSGIGRERFPDGLDWITLSPKTDLPDEIHQAADELKFIVPVNLSPTREESIRAWGKSHPRVWVQPLARGDRPDPEATQRCVQLVETGGGRLRLSLQTHKYIGIP